MRHPDNYRRDLVRSHLGLGTLYKKMHGFEEAKEQLVAAGTNSEPLASSTACLIARGWQSSPTRKAYSWARQALVRGAGLDIIRTFRDERAGLP